MKEANIDHPIVSKKQVIELVTQYFKDNLMDQLELLQAIGYVHKEELEDCKFDLFHLESQFEYSQVKTSKLLCQRGNLHTTAKNHKLFVWKADSPWEKCIHLDAFKKDQSMAFALNFKTNILLGKAFLLNLFYASSRRPGLSMSKEDLHDLPLNIEDLGFAFCQ